MRNLLSLAQSFVNLNIAGSITPAGVLVAFILLLWIAGPVKESPLQSVLHRFSPHYHPEQRLKHLDDKRKDVEHDLRNAKRDLLVETRSRQSREAALANATELRNSFQATYFDRWASRHALRHEAQSKLEEQEDEVASLTVAAEAAEAAVARAQVDADMYGVRLESINKDIECLSDRLCEELSIPFGGLFQSTIFVLLLGYLIGIVLNPVNKLILTGRRGTPRRPDQDPLYLIGKNVITQEDYDALVRNYHRFAQIAASLVAPVFLLGFVLWRWHEHSDVYLLSPVFTTTISVLLWRLATNRYGEFRERVERFIHGRLNFIRTQKQEAERTEQKNALVALAKAITEASKLLKLAHSCGCPKCKGEPGSCKHALMDVIKDAQALLDLAKSSYPPECEAELESRSRALGAAVTLAESRLRDAQATCCSECGFKLNSCKEALDIVSAEAEKLRRLVKTCCGKAPADGSDDSAGSGDSDTSDDSP